jgi:hypothetical protein
VSKQADEILIVIEPLLDVKRFIEIQELFDNRETSVSFQDSIIEIEDNQMFFINRQIVKIHLLKFIIILEVIITRQ